MGQLLATDMNNTEFTGAVANPDALLHVEFYLHKPLDKWSTEEASQKAGRIVRIYGQEQPFIRIMRPGDKDTIIETAVREEHKQRWPEQWLYFQMREGLIAQDQDIPGWKLDEWPHLLDKPDLLRELKFGRFVTVEQVAGCSDAQVQKIGMGGLGLREKARVDLRAKVSKDINEQIASKDKEVADLKDTVEMLREQMAKLMEAESVKKRG
jgi:hypothetical protein